MVGGTFTHYIYIHDCSYKSEDEKMTREKKKGKTTCNSVLIPRDVLERWEKEKKGKKIKRVDVSLDDEQGET